MTDWEISRGIPGRWMAKERTPEISKIVESSKLNHRSLVPEQWRAKLDLPARLIEQVKTGQVVLVLGAGASKGATNDLGEEPPTANLLSQRIAQEFLGGSHADAPLNLVAELAISESDRSAVQEFVRSQLTGYNPASFHLLVPTFRWYGIATTNYDQIIELAYERQEQRAQNPVVLRGDRDRIEGLDRSPDAILYLKLHGCVTRTSDADAPLILTPDQYLQHRQGRSRLYSSLKEWAYEHPVVFIGQAMHDIDLRMLLNDLEKLEESRPRFYLVSPNLSPEEQRLWQSKRITPLSGTFEDFLRSLDGAIPATLRQAKIETRTEHPIKRKLVVSGASLTENALQFLSSDADFVHGALATQTISPRDFYRGVNPGWSAIEQDLDVRRALVDEVLTDIFLLDESDHPTKADLYVIKAEAGAGKTVTMRRIAWEAGVDLDRLCLFTRPYARLDYDAIHEIAELTNERVFLFIDNSADHAPEIEQLIARARADNLPLTIITAERTNEWNMACERLDSLVTRTHRLPYLSPSEVKDLVVLLEKHKSLGYLEPATQSERLAAFDERAGRQILVALHEATQGKMFEDILVDEYNEVQPQAARSLYLSVCVLNRFGVPVRAGLISRVHQIPFSRFREELFSPLEHVVLAEYDPSVRDHLYTARHPHIAQIVFERILLSPEDRYHEYVTLLAALNVAYQTDRVAFRRLVRGRSLQDLFPDHTAVRAIFRLASEIAPDDPFLLQQMAIYEMHRPSGNLEEAQDLLRRARELTEYDKSIIHSMAELERIRAERATNSLERAHHREEARRLALQVRDDPDAGSYAFHTLAKLSLDHLRELLQSADPAEKEIDGAIREAEGYLEQGYQRFPDDEYLLEAEAQLRMLLRDEERALVALQKAFSVNQRSPFIANRLAKALAERGKPEAAEDVLKKALDANPGEKLLHFSYAMMLKERNPTNLDLPIYHLIRSFTTGDRNYEAQFWSATLLYQRNQGDDRKTSKVIFRQLRETRVSHEMRHRIRAAFDRSNVPVDFDGVLRRKEGSFGFIQENSSGDWIYLERDSLPEGMWQRLRVGQRVRFQIGFAFSGPRAVEVRPMA